VKIFLDAAPEVRGLRRYDQLGGSSRKPEIQPEEVIKICAPVTNAIAPAADSPLRAAADAVVLDSTDMTLEEAVQAAVDIVTAKLSKPLDQSTDQLAS